MKTTLVLAAAAAVVSLSVGAADTVSARFGWFGSLAGSCWKAEHADGKTSDTQCFETQYGRFIRGTIKVYEGPALLVESDSVFAVDANTGRIVFTQWAANGNYGSGVITVENATVLTFEPQPAAGSRGQVRYQWIKTSADAFRAIRQKHVGADWTEESSVVYKRVP
ncbi:MAG TPA: hypothetical protein VLT89_06545 [Usitatibacter sp.]|nr:hypothetical protein [Usitatibacter sp.]